MNISMNNPVPEADKAKRDKVVKDLEAAMAKHQISIERPSDNRIVFVSHDGYRVVAWIPTLDTSCVRFERESYRRGGHSRHIKLHRVPERVVARMVKLRSAAEAQAVWESEKAQEDRWQDAANAVLDSVLKEGWVPAPQVNRATLPFSAPRRSGCAVRPHLISGGNAGKLGGWEVTFNDLDRKIAVSSIIEPTEVALRKWIAAVSMVVAVSR